MIGIEVALKLSALLAFVVDDASTWTYRQIFGWIALVIAGLELLAWLTYNIGKALGLEEEDVAITKRGRHLDKFEIVDLAFIASNKLTTALFSYHVIQYCWNSNFISWDFALPSNPLDFPVSFGVQFLAICAAYVVYDVFYGPFHWLLHNYKIYGLVHKHHHRQAAPSRGNLDALNVHPFEFVSGEYCHLLAVYIVANVMGKLFGFQMHILTILVFIVLGGVLASLNHTRFDLQFSMPFPRVLLGGEFLKAALANTANTKSSILWIPLFSVAAHDLHHYEYARNYSQYTMLWDIFFGWFTHPKSMKKVK